MTKVNKNFTLDLEIVAKLKQIDNASKLVESLLTQHFALNGEKKKNLKLNLSSQLKNYSRIAKDLKKKVKILNDFEQKGIDSFTIRWLRGQDFAPSANEIITYKRNREQNFKIDDIIKAWEIIQDNVQFFEEV